MRLTNEETTMSELKRRTELGYFSFGDMESLPSQKEQNKILENILFGFPFVLKGISSVSMHKTILSTEFNVINYFLNGHINFKSSVYTEGYPLDKDQIDKDLLEKIYSTKIKIFYFSPTTKSSIVYDFFDDKYSLEEIENFKTKTTKIKT